MTLDLLELRDDLVAANRILVAKGVLDAYGHVSVRHPIHDESFLISRNLAPGHVSAADVQTYDLAGSTADTRSGYLERYIHSEIYRARPDVMAVVHSHAAALIPFSVSAQPLRAIWHMASFLGSGVPVFEIRDVAGDSSDLLIRDRELGAALASRLRDAAVVLLRGHGAVIVGDSLAHAVHRSVYANLSAGAQQSAVALGGFEALTASEAEAADAANRSQVSRAWDLWRSEVA